MTFSKRPTYVLSYIADTDGDGYTSHIYAVTSNYQTATKLWRAMRDYLIDNYFPDEAPANDHWDALPNTPPASLRVHSWDDPDEYTCVINDDEYTWVTAKIRRMYSHK